MTCEEFHAIAKNLLTSTAVERATLVEVLDKVSNTNSTQGDDACTTRSKS